MAMSVLKRADRKRTRVGQQARVRPRHGRVHSHQPRARPPQPARAPDSGPGADGFPLLSRRLKNPETPVLGPAAPPLVRFKADHQGRPLPALAPPAHSPHPSSEQGPALHLVGELSDSPLTLWGTQLRFLSTHPSTETENSRGTPC